MTSVASKNHFTTIPLKSLRAEDQRRTYQHLWNQTSHLGLPEPSDPNDFQHNLGTYTIVKKDLRLSVNGYQGYLAHDDAEVKLDYIGNHYYLKATVFDEHYNKTDTISLLTNQTQDPTLRKPKFPKTESNNTKTHESTTT
eukprot:2976789-Amphidinium_carterae.1